MSEEQMAQMVDIRRTVISSLKDSEYHIDTDDWLREDLDAISECEQKKCCRHQETLFSFYRRGNQHHRRTQG